MPRLRPAVAVLALTVSTAAAVAAHPKAVPVDAEAAISGFKIPEGMTVKLFAGDDQVANPVAISVDEQGRVFVAETFRIDHGVYDNRHSPWLMDDLAASTLADRLAYYKKYSAKRPLRDYTDHADQIQLLTDTNHDGRADTSRTFAGPFNKTLQGIGADVLAYNGNIYFTEIPDLLLLKDTTGTGHADVQKTLSTGYGIRTSLSGHDLHGLAVGPDGKLYFSIGDRGYNITTPDGRHLTPPIDTGRGAVFRCNLDGSDLEVYYTGLRNPQHLAFDEHGNLFTGDNNSDAGDRARVVYLLEGGDTGWIESFQTMERPYTRGAFTAEKLWYPHFPGQAAWILPPVGWVASGPCGFAYNPGAGTGLPARYAHHFFLGDFRGGPAPSGIWSFDLKPDGAGFTVDDLHQFLWHVLVTDLDFGYDGKLYLTDWINGWDGTGHGRIYTLEDNKAAHDPVVAQVTKLFHEGFAQRPTAELLTLLHHPDMRVRERAQFVLADRRDSADLLAVALHDKNPLARLHGIWGYGMITGDDAKALLPLLHDRDEEVRAQTVKVLGDRRATVDLKPLLADGSPRVRCLAGIAIGKIGDASALEPLLTALRENDDKDPFLRHGLIMGLVGQHNPDALLAHLHDSSSSIRLAIVVALRRLNDPRVSEFLNDPDIGVATEAARAINDLPLPEAMPKLAGMLAKLTAAPAPLDPALVRRAINAAFRLGRPDDARALVKFAADSHQSETMKLEALQAIGDWANPSPRDRVIGVFRPLPQHRDTAALVAALKPEVPGLVATGGKLQAQAMRIAGQYGLALDGAALIRDLADTSRPLENRIEALRALAATHSAKLRDAIKLALADAQPLIRAQARTVLCKIDPSRGLDAIRTVLAHGETLEQQQALATLGGLHSAPAVALLGKELDALIAGKLAPAIRLDAIEAGEKQTGSHSIQSKLKKYRATLNSKDPLAAYQVCLTGGDPDAGRNVFTSHPAAQCIRCHTVDSVGPGGNAGPNLTHVASRGDRAYFLQSLIDPNAKIAAGFGTVAVTLKDGSTVGGNLKTEDAAAITLLTPDGKTRVIPTSQVASHTAPVSAMPPMGLILKPREIRDVIAFLSTLK